jgi:hypothetical protein
MTKEEYEKLRNANLGQLIEDRNGDLGSFSVITAFYRGHDAGFDLGGYVEKHEREPSEELTRLVGVLKAMARYNALPDSHPTNIPLTMGEIRKLVAEFDQKETQVSERDNTDPDQDGTDEIRKEVDEIAREKRQMKARIRLALGHLENAASQAHANEKGYTLEAIYGAISALEGDLE